LNEKQDGGHHLENVGQTPAIRRSDPPMQWFSSIASVGFATVLGACSNAVHGNGQPASEDRPLSGFVAVESASSFDVKVERGNTFSVHVHVDSNIEPLLRTRVVGDTLVIGSDEQVTDLLPGPHVTVTMPRLTSATLSGSGLFSAAGFEEHDPVSLDLSGSGNLDFQGSAPAITARLDGSGEIDLAGSSDQLDLELDGSGSIDARALPARVGSVGLAGSGQVLATLAERVDVSLSGSGHIDLFGGAAIAHASKSGSGEIEQHD
jgi:Putative auto-transporter adhesin, head GIN domain